MNNEVIKIQREAKEKLERLRDEFAIAALHSCFTSYVNYAEQWGYDDNWKQGVAIDCYIMADAMLKARESNNEQI